MMRQPGVECSPVTPDLNTPWQLTWTYQGESEEATAEPPEDVFAQPAKAIQLTRSTFAAFAAMEMYVGFELIDRFDASGERALREALYQFGVERGQGMRQQALSQGRALDFQSWFEVLQERDPAESVFVFRGDSHISPGGHAGRVYLLPAGRGLVGRGRARSEARPISTMSKSIAVWWNPTIRVAGYAGIRSRPVETGRANFISPFPNW